MRYNKLIFWGIEQILLNLFITLLIYNNYNFELATLYVLGCIYCATLGVRLEIVKQLDKVDKEVK